MPAFLPLSQVHIWYYSWEGPLEPIWLDALYPSLSSREREQHLRFRFDKDRNTYLLAHVLLRRVLSLYSDIPESAWNFVSGIYGKPSVANPGFEDLHFNLTHTAGLVACAVRSYAEVGVDAESIGRPFDFLSIARSTFAPAEVRQLENSPAEAQRDLFFRIWTLKESYIKALGLGLNASLKDFSIEVGAGPESMVAAIRFSRQAQGNESDWRLRLYQPTPHHLLATAFAMAGNPELSLHNGTELLQG